MPQSSLQATRAAAASALPPAMPPATGIRLAIVTATPPGPAAPQHPPHHGSAFRECLAQCPDGAECEVVAVFRDQARALAGDGDAVGLGGVTVTSSNRETAWKTVTRPW